MAKNTVRITLEGLPGDDGHVHVQTLIHELVTVSSAIRQTEAYVTGERAAPSFYLRVVNLSHSGPATVELEAVPLDPKVDRCRDVIDRFKGYVRAAATGEIKQTGIGSHLMETIREIASPVGERLARLEVLVSDERIDVTREVAALIDSVLASEEECIGFLRGMLEYINVHADQNVFRIYPDTGPSKVKCTFMPNLREQALAAVGHYVEVRGRMVFRTVDFHPYAVAVNEIEILPDDDQLPDFLDIQGIAPDLTRGQPIVEFLRSIRNA